MVVRRKGRIEVGLYVYTYIQTHVCEIHPHTHTHTHIYAYTYTGLPRWQSSKESACHHRCKRLRFDSWVGNIHWSRKWQPTPGFLPGKFHGQRSMGDYSPWGHKELDTNE